MFLRWMTEFTCLSLFDPVFEAKCVCSRLPLSVRTNACIADCALLCTLSDWQNLELPSVFSEV